MISTSGPIDSNGIVNLQANFKVTSPKDVSFSNELASIIAEKKNKDEKKLDSKVDNQLLNPKNLLNHLTNLNNNFVSISDPDISAIGVAINEPKESIEELFDTLKNNIMKDIKKSLLTLEENVLDSENKVSPSLIKKFQVAIQNIKDDFSNGFQVPFDSVDIKNENVKVDKILLEKITNKLNTLPVHIINKLEQVI